MRALRLANKTQWALQDIRIRSDAAARRWDKAMDIAERNLDPQLMRLLGRLRADLAFMERTAILALNGEYEQPHDEPQQEAKRA